MKGPKMRVVSLAFFAIAVALFGIGLSGQRTFLYVGIVILILAILQLVRNSKR
jgi:hypothetical protein